MPRAAERPGRAVWIARHGNRVDFANQNWSLTAARPHDPELAADGVAQARQLARRLAAFPIKHIFSSPFLRAVETASFAAEALQVTIKIEHGVSEWMNPEWFPANPELLHPRQMAQRFPRVDADYTSRVPHAYPEYREQEDTWVRVARAAAALTREFREDLLIVCHASTMLGLIHALVRPRSASCQLAPLPELNSGLCSLSKVVWNDGTWKLTINGDVSHLTLDRPEAAGAGSRATACSLSQEANA